MGGGVNKQVRKRDRRKRRRVVATVTQQRWVCRLTPDQLSKQWHNEIRYGIGPHRVSIRVIEINKGRIS